MAMCPYSIQTFFCALIVVFQKLDASLQRHTHNKHLTQEKWSVFQNHTFLNVLCGISPKCPDGCLNVERIQLYTSSVGHRIQTQAINMTASVFTWCLTYSRSFIFLHITHLAQLSEEPISPLLTVSPHTDFSGGLLASPNLCLTWYI